MQYGDKMEEKKIFYIISLENLAEIVLKSELSESDLYNDINFILLSKNYFKTMSVSQLVSIKLNDDNYKLQIQINVDESEVDQIVSFINSMNYNQIQS